ncbi:MAG: N-acetylmuramic acid 6-phosphate etherase [Bauldia sp.]|nr:N-acetylmuramic acid 6-phosphate etherase [Bauldia sp.]
MTSTETIDPRYAGLDTWDDKAILAAMIDGQSRAVEAVAAANEALSAAATAIVARLRAGGRLIYAGAGSSGIIAALDGIELLGTYGWPEERVAFVLASGDRLAPLTGGEEDDEGLARAGIARLGLGRDDVVIAVAASGTTPFTLAAVAAARSAGALTVGVANNAGAPLLTASDAPVLLDSGHEIITGSTRMGAGTAQKAALNLLSTLIMIRLGHVYDGLMVNLRADNRKLRGRSVRILRAVTGCSEDDARAALDAAGGSVKHAALIAAGGLSATEAEAALLASGDNLRKALGRG